MALMLAKTYAASKAAGVDEDQAQAAAEELAAFEARFTSIESNTSHMSGDITTIDGKVTTIDRKVSGIEVRLAAIEAKFSILIWAVGINAAATIAILGVLLRHG